MALSFRLEVGEEKGKTLRQHFWGPTAATTSHYKNVVIEAPETDARFDVHLGIQKAGSAKRRTNSNTSVHWIASVVANWSTVKSPT